MCLTHPVALSSKSRRLEVCPVWLPACCFLPARSRPAPPPSSSSRLSPPLHRQRAAPAVLLRLVPVFPPLPPVALACSRLSLQGGSGRCLLLRPELPAPPRDSMGAPHYSRPAVLLLTPPISTGSEHLCITCHDLHCFTPLTAHLPTRAQ